MNAFWIYILVMGILLGLTSVFMLGWSKPLARRLSKAEEVFGMYAGGLFGTILGGCVLLAFSVLLIYAACTRSTWIARDEVMAREVGSSSIGPIIGWPLVVVAGLTLVTCASFVWWGRRGLKNGDPQATEMYSARALGASLGSIGVLGSIPVLGYGLVILSY